jgi:EAL domain-containing protein (putative c-di-GMP-specific phosphodiesterase class I)
VFDAAVDRPTLADHERAALSQRLVKLIEEKALGAVYQPIVHLASGRPLAFEGLIRPAPDRGFESTIALFTAAELTGRIVELDRACLDVVVAGAAALPEEMFVSLNISPRTFEAPEFSAATFAGILARHGIAPGRVILELTEREAIQDVERLRMGLDACRAMGVQIAADDVGAGNAGLRLLSQIKFDVVKIDLSLVQAGPNGEPVESVLRSLVDLANRWGALVVAEGVETPQQLRIVRDLEIGAAQGYLLARPGPIDMRMRYDVGGLIDLAGDWWVPKPETVPLGRAS